MAHRESFSLPVTILLGKKAPSGKHYESALSAVSERNYARDAFAAASKPFSYVLETVTVDRVSEERCITSMDHPLEHKPVFYFSAALTLHTSRGEVTLPITMDAFVKECLKAKAKGLVPDFTHEAIHKMEKLPQNESQNNDTALARFYQGIEFTNNGLKEESKNPVQRDVQQSAPLLSWQWWAGKLHLG